MEKSWYIIQVRSNMEKRVQKLLQERILNAGMQSSFGQVLVPEEKVIEIKNGVRKETMRKIYNGYVFVEMFFSDDAWHVIKGTQNVSGFVSGNQKKPTPLPERDMKVILDRMLATAEAPRPKLEFQVGESLSIVEGPFKDFEATVESVNYNQQKIKAVVTIFGRSTPIDLDFSYIVKKA